MRSAPTLLALLLLAGCGEQMATYRAAGHDPAAVKAILVLPFRDARTFRDPRDPHIDTAVDRSRELFVAAMKRHPAFQGKQILAPALKLPDAIGLSEAVEAGAAQGADLVVAGQIFSFTETRAASIPARAGMFIRIFSVPERKLVFVGDDYQAANGPGGRGGREAQADRVASAILSDYVSRGAPGTRRRALRAEVREADAGPKLLVLPYHDRPNTDNLIEQTGGGEVTGALFQMELGKTGKLRLLEPGVGEVPPGKLLTVEETLALGKKAGADFVLRGQVVEFRRAMSVPSWYSAIISVAVLAAQVMFAESSGVDIATEVWRVADGKCVYARRDVARGKYVVQTEKTVRSLAVAAVPIVLASVSRPDAPETTPLIDTMVVVTRQPAPGATPVLEPKPATTTEAAATGEAAAPAAEVPAAAPAAESAPAPAAEAPKAETPVPPAAPAAPAETPKPESAPAAPVGAAPVEQPPVAPSAPVQTPAPAAPAPAAPAPAASVPAPVAPAASAPAPAPAPAAPASSAPAPTTTAPVPPPPPAEVAPVPAAGLPSGAAPAATEDRTRRLGLSAED